MKILVTGGVGFIGSHLVPTLRTRGHKVRTLDRIASADYACDLHSAGISAALDDFRPDVVVHMAAQVGRLFGEDNVRESVRSNAEATTVVAWECARRGIRLAYTSSSEVYGDQGDNVCYESGLMALPHNIYGLSKLWGEEAIQLYVPSEQALVFRLSMPYGPGAPPGRGRRAMDTLLWQAHHRMEMTVHRGAERSWCWVGDTVNGMVMLLEGDHSGVWNIGRDDQPLAMIDLAKRCCRLADAPLGLIELVEAPERQTVVKRLSTDKLRSIGWCPTVELDEGLPKMYEWIQNFDEEGRWQTRRGTRSSVAAL